MHGSLVAVGDSITNGHNDMLAGVPGWSWAHWLADTMNLSYTRYARGGATSTQIVTDLLPNVTDDYTIGAFNMGTNDALSGWDAGVFEANFTTAAETLTARCGRVVALTVPQSAEATAIVHRVADEHGVLVVDATLTGIRYLKADKIHPSALGQLEIADRAATVLGVVRPSDLAKDHGKGSMDASYVIGYPFKRLNFTARRTVRKLIPR